ncbi:MAG: cytochrome c family protein [Acidobacteriota bacterium]|nr:cytochrome c family protein [Acidobacteriota bacterium]MDH3784537.1 cytochrome c family protein [Acidobacteriota bacterium]
MKTSLRLTIALIVIFGLAVAGVAVARLAWPSVEQPIAFSHRLHVTDLGSACTDCHLYAESGVRATIPNLETCGFCHEEAQTESPDEARLVEHIEAGEPIPWRKVYRVPDHVYFSHRRHTAIAGIDCTECHGAMEEQEEPVSRPAVRITMNGCMDCHDENGVSNDCLLCHK